MAPKVSAEGMSASASGLNHSPFLAHIKQQDTLVVGVDLAVPLRGIPHRKSCHSAGGSAEAQRLAQGPVKGRNWVGGLCLLLTSCWPGTTGLALKPGKSSFLDLSSGKTTR